MPLSSITTTVHACAPGGGSAPCTPDAPLLGPTTPTAQDIIVPEGRAVEITAWSLPAGGTVTVSMVDTTECVVNTIAAYTPCGAPMSMSAAFPTVLLGPGRYRLTAVGALSGFNVRVRTEYSLDDIDLRAWQCPPAPPPPPPQHLLNGAGVPVVIGPGGQILAPSGDNGYTVTPFDPVAFCAAVNACVAPLTPLTLQEVLGTLPPFLGASGTGDDSLTFAYSPAAFTTAVQAEIPDQTVTGAFSPGVTLVGSGKNGVVATFDAAAFCAAVNACVAPLTPLTLQEVLGTLPSWLGASGTGDDSITFAFNQAGFDAAVTALIPNQTVNGVTTFSGVPFISFQGTGQNNVDIAYNPAVFQSEVESIATALDHPPAVLTNNLAPFAWSTPTQVGNIPLVTTAAVTAPNQLTITPGDGSAPTVFNAVFPADIFLTNVTFSSATNDLTMTLSDGTVLNVALDTLLEVVTADSSTVDFSGLGTPSNPLTAAVRVSAAGGNALTVVADGLFVPTPAVFVETPLTVNDSSSIDFTASGTTNHTLTGEVRISATAGNTATINADGLFVPAAASAVETPLTANDSATIDFTQSGLAGHTFTGSVKLSATAGNAITQNADGLYLALPSPATPCTIGSQITAVSLGAAAVHLLAMNAAGCLIKIAPDTIELRDCNNALVARFLAISI